MVEVGSYRSAGATREPKRAGLFSDDTLKAQAESDGAFTIVIQGAGEKALDIARQISTCYDAATAAGRIIVGNLAVQNANGGTSYHDLGSGGNPSSTIFLTSMPAYPSERGMGDFETATPLPVVTQD